MYNAENRVIVAVSSSNINRVQQIINATNQNGRVCSCREKYDDNPSAGDQAWLCYSRRRIICTRSRSEENGEKRRGYPDRWKPRRAACCFNKMAKQNHKQLHIEKDDTVVIASTPLPDKNSHTLKQWISLQEAEHKSFLRKNVYMYLDMAAKKS